jgi:penicillin G amidase
MVKRLNRRRAGRILLGVLIAVVVIVVALGGAGYVLVRRTLPQTRGTIHVAGMQQGATVIRDQWGVPHITAGNLHDLAFAQGYVTAQDRLFQMEFNRRVAAGRLAELFGAGPDNSLIDADSFLRTLGLEQSARGELTFLDAQTRTELQAYADGVNAFVGTHKSSLPLELTILGVTPEPWTPTDSLAYGRVVALDLDNEWLTKYTRAMVRAKAGPNVADALFPTYPDANPTLLDELEAANGGGHTSPAPRVSATAPAATLARAQSAATPARQLDPQALRGAAVVHALLGNVSDALGSNDWVVDGTRTTTGKPLLANDPHLGINMPSIWYEVGLRGGGLDALGFSFPGVPGIVIGHNAHIAWGVTNVGADDTDLYLETLDPAGHPGQYLYDGQWTPLETRTETIKVRGGSPVTITVRSTRHGPLLNGVQSDLTGFAPVALKWTALQPGYSFQGFLQLAFASDWQEFTDAVSRISISQNFVYADTEGNIGYRMSGILPLRSADNRLVPVDGSTPAHEWQGYVPQKQMPQALNPTTHFIATANNQIVAPDFPVYVTSTWDQGYRARRIVDLLTAKPTLSISDFQSIQADVYSVPAATLTPALIAAGNAAGGDAATAASLLQGWDYTLTRGSAAAAVYEVAAGELAREVIEPLLGKKLYDIYRGNYSSSGIFSVLLGVVAEPQAPFFGLASGADGTAARDATLALALRHAMADLRATLGGDPTRWQWGTLHEAHFNHPLASTWPLSYLFATTPVERPGDGVTVSVGGDGGFSNDPPSYDQRTVSSMREIIDLSDFDRSLWVTTTGESGQPMSPHYSDLIPLWDQNRYQAMDYTPEAQARAGVDALSLEP